MQRENQVTNVSFSPRRWTLWGYLSSTPQPLDKKWPFPTSKHTNSVFFWDPAPPLQPCLAVQARAPDSHRATLPAPAVGTCFKPGEPRVLLLFLCLYFIVLLRYKWCIRNHNLTRSGICIHVWSIPKHFLSPLEFSLYPWDHPHATTVLLSF